MTNAPHMIYAAVYVLFEREGKFLFLRRANTGYRDGDYTLPAGHIEENELPTTTAIREMSEEVGITVASNALIPVHTMYRISEGRTYTDFYYKVSEWDGEPYIAEPEKADDLQWFTPSELPSNTLDGVRLAIQAIASNQYISEHRAV